MLLILRSTSLSSSPIAASPLRWGPVISVRDPPDLADPVVTPLPVFALLPDDCAVPEELVPGVCGDAWRDALPAPLGSSLEFFNPPGAAGPGGTPLMPCDPAPAEPALGEPAALPLVLPADDPPADPPADPPELWASEAAGNARSAIAVMVDVSFIENLLFDVTTPHRALFLPERFPRRIIDLHPAQGRSDCACAN
jgi:hypothetical protein